MTKAETAQQWRRGEVHRNERACGVDPRGADDTEAGEELVEAYDAVTAHWVERGDEFRATGFRRGVRTVTDDGRLAYVYADMGTVYLLHRPKDLDTWVADGMQRVGVGGETVLRFPIEEVHGRTLDEAMDACGLYDASRNTRAR